ncbi:MAG: aromatic amino acid transport family protein [Candidatus Shapirobacteria bacterium]|jgi:hypothetical protein
MFSIVSKRLLIAILLQLSGILGAGMFVLPYVFSRSNFVFATFGLIVLAYVMIQLNSFYTDIILSTKGDHQLSGYSDIYFGRRLKILSLINIFILGLGALFAYLQLGTSFISTLLPLTPNLSTTIFFIAVSFFHLAKIPLLKNYYQVIPVLTIFIVIVLLSLALQLPSPPLELAIPSWAFFGSTVFALTGFTVIPEVEEYLRPFPHKRHRLIASTIYGQVFAALIYFFFAFSIIHISGPYLTADVVTGLSYVSPNLARLVSFLGLILVFEASLNFLMIFKETFFRDFNLSLPNSYLLSFLIFAFSLIFLKVPLVTILSLTGSVTIFVSAIIICLIRLKINRGPKLIAISLLILLVFFFGLLSELAVF